MCPKHPIMAEIITLKIRVLVTSGCISSMVKIDKTVWFKLIVFFKGGKSSLCRRLHRHRINYNSNDLLLVLCMKLQTQIFLKNNKISVIYTVDTKIYYFFSTSFFAGHKIRVEWYKVCINKIRNRKNTQLHTY